MKTFVCKYLKSGSNYKIIFLYKKILNRFLYLRNSAEINGLFEFGKQTIETLDNNFNDISQ
jgi:hypothetical protein